MTPARLRVTPPTTPNAAALYAASGPTSALIMLRRLAIATGNATRPLTTACKEAATTLQRCLCFTPGCAYHADRRWSAYSGSSPVNIRQNATREDIAAADECVDECSARGPPATGTREEGGVINGGDINRPVPVLVVRDIGLANDGVGRFPHCVFSLASSTRTV